MKKKIKLTKKIYLINKKFKKKEFYHFLSEPNNSVIVPFYKKDYFSRGLILLYFLNLFFSVLTIEFGNRWWLILNLFSIYLLSNVAYSIKSFTLIKS